MKKKKTTYGIFVYSIPIDKILICKASGNYGGWSIPKGMPEEGEIPLESASRELKEETGLDRNTLIISFLYDLGETEYKSGKKILHSFLLMVKDDLSRFNFNCESMVDGKYPEISQYLLADLEVAKSMIHEAQASRIVKIKEIINLMRIKN